MWQLQNLLGNSGILLDRGRIFVGRGFSHDISLQLSAALAAEGPILQFTHKSYSPDAKRLLCLNLWVENYRALRPGA